MTVTEFMIPVWKWCGFLFVVFLAYQIGNWNGFVEGVNRCRSGK